MRQWHGYRQGAAYSSSHRAHLDPAAETVASDGPGYDAFGLVAINGDPSWVGAGMTPSAQHQPAPLVFVRIADMDPTTEVDRCRTEGGRLLREQGGLQR